MILLVVTSMVFAQKAAVFNSGGVAIKGYDMVAFFKDKNL